MENKKISTCLWFDDQAEEAANFYTSVFANSKIIATSRYDKASAESSGRKEGSVMTVGFTIENFSFLALNGGPLFEPNPSISFFVNCEREAEVNHLWEKLLEGGEALMPLDKYPFANRYGWVQDKFGISWQLIYANKPEGDWRPKIMPSLLFTKENTGKAAEAITFYTSVFYDSKNGIQFPYPEDTGSAQKGDLAYADLKIENTWIAMMDSGTEQAFTFNEGISLVVHCENQEVIDDYWETLTSNGGEEGQCGWLKDKYGLAWQVVPKNLGDFLVSKEATKALMQMKKIDIEQLKNS